MPRKKKTKNRQIIDANSLVVVMIPFTPNYMAKHYGAQGDEGKENVGNMVDHHKDVISHAKDDLKSLQKQIDKGQQWQTFEKALIYPKIIYLGSQNVHKGNSLEEAIKYFTRKTNGTKDEIKNLAVNISGHGNPRFIGSLGDVDIPPDGTTGLADLVDGYFSAAGFSDNTQFHFYFRTCNSALIKIKNNFDQEKFQEQLKDLKRELIIKRRDTSGLYEDEKKVLERKINYKTQSLEIEQKKAKLQEVLGSSGNKKKKRSVEKEIKQLEKQIRTLDAKEKTYIARFSRELELPNVIKVSGHSGYTNIHENQLVVSRKRGDSKDIARGSKSRVIILGNEVILPEQTIHVEDEYGIEITADRKFLNKYYAKKAIKLNLGILIVATIILIATTELDNDQDLEESELRSQVDQMSDVIDSQVVDFVDSILGKDASQEEKKDFEDMIWDSSRKEEVKNKIGEKREDEKLNLQNLKENAKRNRGRKIRRKFIRQDKRLCEIYSNMEKFENLINLEQGEGDLDRDEDNKDLRPSQIPSPRSIEGALDKVSESCIVS